MKEAELFAMLRSGQTREGNLRERKPGSIKAQEVRRVVVAFANSTPEGQESVLYVGLHDKTGEVLGLSETDKVQRGYRDAIAECYPPITYQMHALQFDGKALLAIVVPSSSRKPHFAGAAYIREGASCKQASDELYKELVLSQHDKARRLLEFKRNHTHIRVHGVNYHLGSLKPFSGGGHFEGGEEHKVVECDGHTVRFTRLRDSWSFSESLERLSIEFDAARNCPVVNVQAPGR